MDPHRVDVFHIEIGKHRLHIQLCAAYKRRLMYTLAACDMLEILRYSLLKPLYSYWIYYINNPINQRPPLNENSTVDRIRFRQVITYYCSNIDSARSKSFLLWISHKCYLWILILIFLDYFSSTIYWSSFTRITIVYFIYLPTEDSNRQHLLEKMHSQIHDIIMLTENISCKNLKVSPAHNEPTEAIYRMEWFLYHSFLNLKGCTRCMSLY